MRNKNKGFKIRRRKSRLKLTGILAAVLFFLLLLRLAAVSGRTDMYKYYGMDKNGGKALVIGSAVVGDGVIERDGISYIEIDVVKEYLDPNIYYNADENRVIITTENEVLRLDTQGQTDLNFPVFSEDGRVYLPVSLTERVYGVKKQESEGFISLDTEINEAAALKKTRIYAGTSKKEYFADVKKDTLFYFYGEDPSGLVCVKEISSGIVGYVKAENIRLMEKTVKEEEKTVLKLPDGKICLAFDQIANAAGAAATMSSGVPTGVNVLCPTWFSFKDQGGEIVNKANADYVDWAHANGVQVWGLVTDNFDSGISHAVISNDETRKYAIDQLAAYAQTYGLDGINIDFEAVPKDDGKYWVQFLRELVPVCHENGLVVSADLFVPKLWSAHYNRKAVGETVDKVIVMGYDEHYGGSSESGSVASYDWSVSAIKNTIDQGVPKEKLILGIPFYTRIWVEHNGTTESKAYSMDAAAEMLEQNAAEFSFDEKTKQNYAEFTDEEGRHRCWIEDEDSIKMRVDLVKEYDISGIAAWKLKMEKDGIFEIIDTVLK